jgi:hypothetical protein
MKTKTIGIAILCAVLALSAWTLGHSQQTAKTTATLPSGTNRYPIVAADIDFSAMGGKLPHKSAIRIDTQTGKTWELTEIDEPKGAMSFVWVSLNEEN